MLFILIWSKFWETNCSYVSIIQKAHFEYFGCFAKFLKEKLFLYSGKEAEKIVSSCKQNKKQKLLLDYKMLVNILLN